jgi:hypothetical protein
MNARQRKKAIVGSKVGSITAVGGGFRVLKDSSGYWLTCPCGYDPRCRGRHGVEVSRGSIGDVVRCARRVYDALVNPYLARLHIAAR